MREETVYPYLRDETQAGKRAVPILGGDWDIKYFLEGPKDDVYYVFRPTPEVQAELGPVNLEESQYYDRMTQANERAATMAAREREREREREARWRRWRGRPEVGIAEGGEAMPAPTPSHPPPSSGGGKRKSKHRKNKKSKKRKSKRSKSKKRNSKRRRSR